jgi:hypothetical protein
VRFSEGTPNTFQSELKTEWSLDATGYRRDIAFPPVEGYAGDMGEIGAFLGASFGNKILGDGTNGNLTDTYSDDAGTVTVDRTRTKTGGTWDAWVDNPVDPPPYPAVAPNYFDADLPVTVNVSFGSAAPSQSVIPDVLKVGSLYYPIIEVTAGTMLHTVRTKSESAFATPLFWAAEESDATCEFLGMALPFFDSWHAGLLAQETWVPVNEDGNIDLVSYALTGSVTVEALDWWEWGGRFDASTGALV